MGIGLYGKFKGFRIGLFTFIWFRIQNLTEFLILCLFFGYADNYLGAHSIFRAYPTGSVWVLPVVTYYIPLRSFAYTMPRGCE